MSKTATNKQHTTDWVGTDCYGCGQVRNALADGCGSCEELADDEREFIVNVRPENARFADEVSLDWANGPVTRRQLLDLVAEWDFTGFRWLDDDRLEAAAELMDYSDPDFEDGREVTFFFELVEVTDLADEEEAV